MSKKKRKKNEVVINFDISEMLKEDACRLSVFTQKFDPITGEGSVPQPRVAFFLDEVQWWIPESMNNMQIVRDLVEAGGIARYCRLRGLQGCEDLIKKQLMITRCKHDFAFWAAMFVVIKVKQPKPGEKGVMPFVLNYPQRKTLAALEEMRLANKPIRMIILKARQWGGSTLVQMYMAWIQLMHKENWASAIVAHQTSSALNIRSMYRRMVAAYPPSMIGCDENTPLQLSPFGGSRTEVTISQGRHQVRDNVICVGSMQSPDSIRGQDIALAHFSEVGLWRATEGKSPEDVIQAISSAILPVPYTMDVMESTAKGEGNLFHHEWLAAKAGIKGGGGSNRYPMFVPWYEIELYHEDFACELDKVKFAVQLWEHREDTSTTSDREEPGCYLWWLWEQGATLSAINWYITRRKSYRGHDAIASEFPSDDIEAFAHSGQPIFDAYKIDDLRQGCRPPVKIGELEGDDIVGAKSLQGLHFVESKGGMLKIWEMPDESAIRMRDRYVVSVDVGGKGDKSDWSVIVVIDRYWRTQGEGDVIVAEWRGHLRHDLLAWKMAQIAEWYNRALLVVESNTYEQDYHKSDGDNTFYILDQIGAVYRNMYARQASADSVRKTGKARRWGFQTNAKTKEQVINNLRILIDTDGYIERESGACDEYATYERDERGKPNATGNNHDDRVMARAIGLWVSCGLPTPRMGRESGGNPFRTTRRVGGMANF